MKALLPQVRPEHVLFASKCFRDLEKAEEVLGALKITHPAIYDIVRSDIEEAIRYIISGKGLVIGNMSVFLNLSEWKLVRDQVVLAIAGIFGLVYAVHGSTLPSLPIAKGDVRVRADSLRLGSGVNPHEEMEMEREVIEIAGKLGGEAENFFQVWINYFKCNEPSVVRYLFLIYSHLVLFKIMQYYS